MSPKARRLVSRFASAVRRHEMRNMWSVTERSEIEADLNKATRVLSGYITETESIASSATTPQFSDTARQLAFLLLRARQALSAVNSLLQEQGLIGVLEDATTLPSRYEKDQIKALLENVT